MISLPNHLPSSNESDIHNSELSDWKCWSESLAISVGGTIFLVGNFNVWNSRITNNLKFNGLWDKSKNKPTEDDNLSQVEI